MSQIQSVILDIDGTLVDSNDAQAHAWIDAMAEAGHQVSFEQVRPLIGMGGDKVLPVLSMMALRISLSIIRTRRW